MVGVCRKKSEETRGMFATVGFAILLELIGRSLLPHEGQVGERGEAMRLDWNRGHTIFMSTANNESTIAKRGGQIIYI